MALMAVLGAMLLAGLALTLRWGALPYVRWAGRGPAGGAAGPAAGRAGPADGAGGTAGAVDGTAGAAGAAGAAGPEAARPGDGAAVPAGPAEEPGPGPIGAGAATVDGFSLRRAAVRYLRGLAVALVGGFWAGALVTGPGVRLVMRLLAVTAGDDAQGAVTEAEEIVGDIDLDGTIGLYLFGGILPGLLSGAIYVLVRRWLPAGRLGGVVFGALHLVVAATRIDPLRPENPDFDIVGPGWLSVATFGLLCVAHGMAVAAIANRYSASFPPPAGAGPRRWARLGAPLVLPALLALTPAPIVMVSAGLLLSLGVQLADWRLRLAERPPVLVAGRVALAALALLLLPGTLTDLRDIVDRDRAAAPLTRSGS